jgi:hypothetical protein
LSAGALELDDDWGPVSADLGTRTTSLRVPFGNSEDSGMCSSVVFKRALVIIFNTGGCLVISLEKEVGSWSE